MEELDHIVSAIGAAKLHRDPFTFAVFDDLLPEGLYQSVIDEWPEDDWRELVHPDQQKEDGSYRRRQQPLQLHFPHLHTLLATKSVREAFREKLGGTLPQACYPVPLLVDDEAGYWIRPHPDAGSKLLTVQLYLGDDDSQPHLGTRMIVRPPSGVFRHVPYGRNRGYAFMVSNQSWHEVKPDICDAPRRAIQLIYYRTPNPAINYRA